MNIDYKQLHSCFIALVISDMTDLYSIRLSKFWRTIPLAESIHLPKNTKRPKLPSNLTTLLAMISKITLQVKEEDFCKHNTIVCIYNRNKMTNIQ